MSIVNLPILIVGASKLSRRDEALNLAKDASSKFDTHVLDAVETPGIGDVRNFQVNFSRRPFGSKYQTFIILEAQNLTLEAQNALLKILEEPARASTPDSCSVFLNNRAKARMMDWISPR